MNDEKVTPLRSVLDSIQSGVNRLQRPKTTPTDQPDGSSNVEPTVDLSAVRNDSIDLLEEDIVAENSNTADTPKVDTLNNKIKNLPIQTKLLLLAALVSVVIVVKNQQSSDSDVPPNQHKIENSGTESQKLDNPGVDDQEGLSLPEMPETETNSVSGSDSANSSSLNTESHSDVSVNELGMPITEPDDRLGLASPSIASTADADPEPGFPFGSKPTSPTDLANEQLDRGSKADPMVGEPPKQTIPQGAPPVELSGIPSENQEDKAKEKPVGLSDPKDAPVQDQLVNDHVVEDLKATVNDLRKQVKALEAKSNEERIERVKPKVTVSRPALCVLSIAEAARNCSTCTPHALVKFKGQESWLGDGDSLSNLRVSIKNDVIKLSDESGTNVFKYWSSPNGCSG